MSSGDHKPDFFFMAAYLAANKKQRWGLVAIYVGIPLCILLAFLWLFRPYVGATSKWEAAYSITGMEYTRIWTLKESEFVSLLNSKLSVAEQKSIQLNVKAHIPKGIEMTDVEMCSVLGNLLDNAIEACEKLPCDKRFLRVYIDKFKGQFYLSVQNSSPSIQRDKGIFRTTKAGTHGFGLFRIDRIAKKYGGYVNRQYEEGVFATELLLPLSG